MEKQRWDQRRERVRRKKMQAREKVAKPRNTVFFQWFVAPEGRKVGSLKRRVWSHVARWEMNNCTPLWREAHVEVKMYKAPHVRTAFGSWDVEKVHAVVARSTCGSQNAQSTSCLDDFWKLWCRKSARRCGAKHMWKSTCTKHCMFGRLLEVVMSKKCTPLWHEAHVEVNMYKTLHVWTTFGSWDVEKVHAVVARSTCGSQHVQNTACLDDVWKLRCLKSACGCGAKHISKSKVLKTDGFGALFLDVQMWFCVAVARDCAPSQKMSKTWGFLAFPKTMAGVGRLKRIWKDEFSVAGAIQETCSSEMLGGQGADFLRGVAFWSIRFSGRWFCVTGATLCMTWHHVVVAGAILQRHGLEKIQNALVRGRQLCIQVSIIEGSLAELLRFWCCQLWGESRRIASLSSLQIADRKMDR